MSSKSFSVTIFLPTLNSSTRRRETKHLLGRRNRMTRRYVATYRGHRIYPDRETEKQAGMDSQHIGHTSMAG